jgi:putative flippase GtrA
MACAGMALNTGIVWVAVHPLGINYLVAQVFATGVVLVFNFVVGKLWTFRSPAVNAAT